MMPLALLSLTACPAFPERTALGLSLLVTEPPKPRFLFATSNTLVTAYNLDPRTGRITGSSLSFPISVTGDIIASADGKNVYVLASSSVEVFATGSSVNRLNSTSAPAVPGFAVEHPSGKYIYVNSPQGFYTYGKINTDGNLAEIGSFLSAGTDPGGLSAHPNGQFLIGLDSVVPTVNLYPITNGIPSGPFSIASVAGGKKAEMDSRGNYFYQISSTGQIGIFQVDGSGILTEVNTLTFASVPLPVVRSSPDGTEIFITHTSNIFERFRITPEGGTVPLGGFTIGTNAVDVDRDFTGKYYYTASQTSFDVFRLDPVGGLSLIQSFPVGMPPLNIAVVSF